MRYRCVFLRVVLLLSLFRNAEKERIPRFRVLNVEFFRRQSLRFELNLLSEGVVGSRDRLSGVEGEEGYEVVQNSTSLLDAFEFVRVHGTRGAPTLPQEGQRQAEG